MAPDLEGRCMGCVSFCTRTRRIYRSAVACVAIVYLMPAQKCKRSVPMPSIRQARIDNAQLSIRKTRTYSRFLAPHMNDICS